MPDLDELFGGQKLSADELRVRAGQLGAEIGDTAALKSDYEARIRELKYAHAVERELDHSGVKNRGIAEKLLDPGRVTFDDDGVHGIAEQLAELKQSDPYLFEEARPAAKTRAAFGFPHGRETPDVNSLSDEEFYRRIKKL